MNTAEAIALVCNEVRDLLIDKNRKYGNSALEPMRVFSKASPREQLLVRMDDKLSRIKNAQPDDEEDALLDLLGYLVLERVQRKIAESKPDMTVPKFEPRWTVVDSEAAGFARDSFNVLQGLNATANTSYETWVGFMERYRKEQDDAFVAEIDQAIAEKRAREATVDPAGPEPAPAPTGQVDPNEAPEGYVAIADERNTCLGCAFERPDGGCFNTGVNCISGDRSDGHRVIFVRKETR